MYGVQSASAIVLPPQACTLALGAVVDAVVPNTTPRDGDEMWQVCLSYHKLVRKLTRFISFELSGCSDHGGHSFL